MKRLILALILLVVVLITGCADAGRRDQDKKICAWTDGNVRDRTHRRV